MLFISIKTVANMRWHHDKRANDGVLQHLADSEAWKKFDQIHESFTLNLDNLRVGFDTDGINTFGNMSFSYNTWPIILFPYNLSLYVHE